VVEGEDIMLAQWWGWLARRGRPAYARRPAVVLVNGLAEQAESWYCNVDAWRRHFDVHTPNLLAYEGPALQRRVADGLAVDVDYLVGQLRLYLDSFVQSPTCHLVANSLGGKIAVAFAARYPEQVGRLVLLCPSGLSHEERLPIIEGVRRSDLRSLVDSVFADPGCVDRRMLAYFERQFANRRWRTGLLRVIRGTMEHRVRDLLPRVPHPTLLIVGSEDRIVDPAQVIEAAGLLPSGRLIVLRRCGHAPQIEKAALINRCVAEFLTEGAEEALV
jgi:pimeloyl-ACP methyl ester carboxylesterase